MTLQKLYVHQSTFGLSRCQSKNSLYHITRFYDKKYYSLYIYFLDFYGPYKPVCLQ